MIRKIFGKKSEKAPVSADIFATTMVPRPNTLSGDDQYHCMVARARIDGLWEVAEESFFAARATGSMIPIPHRPGGAEPQIVDANTAYEMLMAYEDEQYSPGDSLTKTLEGAGYVAAMKGIAAVARVEAAEKSGGIAMKMAAARKARRKRASTPKA